MLAENKEEAIKKVENKIGLLEKEETGMYFEDKSNAIVGCNVYYYNKNDLEIFDSDHDLIELGVEDVFMTLVE